MNRLRSGFTLLELMVIIILVGILLMLMPNLTIQQERELCREAVENLKLIARAQKLYRQQYGFFYPNVSTTSDYQAINRNITLELVDLKWNYTVDASIPDNVTILAQRNLTGGTYASCNYTLYYNVSISTNPEEPTGTSGCPYP